jgi:hypothetical protein
MRKAIILALLLACGTALAAEWVPIPLTNPNKVVLIDTTSVSVSGPVRCAWFKLVMPPHTAKGVGIYERRFVAYVLMRTAFDCEQKNSRTDGAQSFYEDGTNSTTTPTTLLEWAPVAPDSMADALLSYICAWRPT